MLLERHWRVGLVLFSELMWNMVGRKLSSSKICSSQKRNAFCTSHRFVLFLNTYIHMKHTHTQSNILTSSAVTNGSGLKGVYCAFLRCNTHISSTECFGPKNILQRNRDPGSHLSRPIYLIT